jgi:hypothetical protein
MWIFSVEGFYSVACATKPDGSIDRQTVMIRARCKQHLQNLKVLFPALSGAEIVTLRNRDYLYRIIVVKAVWVAVLTELAQEQEWSNFKGEVGKRHRKVGAAYVAALHEIWEIMYRLQKA